MKKLNYLTLSVLFLISQIIYSQGLLFHANYEPISQRSSLYLFDKNTEVFEDFLDISFEFSLYDRETFGFLFFVNDEKNKSSYAITLSPENEFVHLKFNIVGKNSLLNIPIPKEKLGIRRWQKIKIKLNNKENEILFQLNNDNYVVKTRTHSVYKPVLIFGKYKSYIDLPKFAIRNITVKGKNKAISFKLDQKEGNIVTDTKGRDYGYIENPIWMINDSYKWTLRCKKVLQNPGVVNYDEKKQLFYILNKDSLFVYDLKSNNISHKIYANVCPAEIRLGTNYIDTNSQKLFVYEINNLPLNTVSMSALNLNTLNWEVVSTYQLPWQLHHHASFFEKKTGTYTIFGGFGNQHYFNNFVSFDKPTKKWVVEQFSGDKIQPRFFLGQAQLDSTRAILFGGIGNEAGDITVGKEYYYDCYLIDYSTKLITKKWETPLSTTGLVPARNMIMNEDNTAFYALCYPEYVTSTQLKLYKFSLKDGKSEILGDSISYISDKIESNVNLYYNKLTQEIYCTTQVFDQDGKTNTISIYSITSPPLSEVSPLIAANIFSKFHIPYLLIVAFFIGAIFYILHRKMVIKKENLAKISNIKYDTIRIKKNSIYVFGDFLVFDKDGLDISHLFNPKLKLLFLYILFKGLENNRGVDSHEIHTSIWPDKSSENAKNLKGVALNQIRKILADINGIELSFKNGYFNFDIDNQLYFDYLQVKKLLDENSSVKNSEATMRSIAEIAARGLFLQSTTNCDLSSLKLSIVAKIRDILFPQMIQLYKEHKYADTVMITNILLCLDNCDEIILKYEIDSYLKLGMKDAARKRYVRFLNYLPEEKKEHFPLSVSEYTQSKT